MRKVQVIEVVTRQRESFLIVSGLSFGALGNYDKL